MLQTTYTNLDDVNYINWKLTCVSVNMREVATSNLLGLDKYLFCRNCRSSSSSCCDVNAVRGRLVFPNNAAEGPPGAQPEKKK